MIGFIGKLSTSKLLLQRQKGCSSDQVAVKKTRFKQAWWGMSRPPRAPLGIIEGQHTNSNTDDGGPFSAWAIDEAIVPQYDHTGGRGEESSGAHDVQPALGEHA